MANENNLAHPYANAIFGVAKSTNTVDAWLSDLARLAKVAESDDFAGLISNPNMSKDAILGILSGFIDQISQPVKQLLALLQDNDRLHILPEIYSLFEHKVEEDRNIAKATIQSAYAMSDADREKFEQLLSKKFGKTITAKVELHPELIGGIKILINDQVVDYSVKGSLDNLTTKLIS